MFFLKKPTFHTNEQTVEPIAPSSTPILEQEIPSEDLENTDSLVNQEFSYETPTLFGKFLRNQKLYSGPETSFEDEAWAPEYQPVRLFHRQWGITEEQISSSYDPQ